jgi:hypothetical protein
VRGPDLDGRAGAAAGAAAGDGRLTTTADRLEIVHLITRNSVDEYVRSKLLERADISQQMTRSQALELLTT